MTPTIHQRVHLWLWHWRDGPGWVRSDSPELRALYAEGARVIRVQLQDDGLLSHDLVDLWKSIGFKVWGAVEPRGDAPEEFAEWVAAEKRGLGLQGMDFDHEDQVRAADLASNGAWSELFAKRFRELCPLLPCALDSYFGSAAGGINLGAYTTRGFRMNVQTYWGAEGIWDDPPTNMVKWCAGANPTIPKAVVKPIIRVSANNSGELPDQDVVIADCKAAATRGLAFYYIDGAPFEYLRSFIRRSIAAGIAY